MSAERVEERLRQLEHMFYHGSQEKGSYSTEALLDALLVLYEECCNSTLRRDKNIIEFIENGKVRLQTKCYYYSPTDRWYIGFFTVKPVSSKIKQCRLRRDDFEPLSLIGKGAFGEVREPFYSVKLLIVAIRRRFGPQFNSFTVVFQVTVVRMRDNGRVFAMKTLNKWEMLKRAEVSFKIYYHTCERAAVYNSELRWTWSLVNSILQSCKDASNVIIRRHLKSWKLLE